MSSKKLSVSITTYNHRDYIEQALDSALMQKTNFNYEIMVGEDDSSDGTREIVKKYRAQCPDKIRLFLNDRKDVIYINGKATGRWNFINNLKNAQGEYIALLEGDDYWTDPHKLQRQVDFLESHPEFSSCFHWVGWLDQGSGKIVNPKYGPSVILPHYTIDDLLQYGNFVATCSVVFRNYMPDYIPGWFYHIPVGDFPLHILNAQRGKLGLIDRPMAIYRRHEGGIYGSQTHLNNCKTSLQTYAIIGKNLNVHKRVSYRLGVLNWKIQLINNARQGNLLKTLFCGLQALNIAPGRRKINTLIEVLVILLPIPIGTRIRAFITLTKQKIKTITGQNTV